VKWLWTWKEGRKEEMWLLEANAGMNYTKPGEVGEQWAGFIRSFSLEAVAEIRCKHSEPISNKITLGW
jgi:hypothetical protein